MKWVSLLYQKDLMSKSFGVDGAFGCFTTNYQRDTSSTKHQTTLNQTDKKKKHNYIQNASFLVYCIWFEYDKLNHYT